MGQHDDERQQRRRVLLAQAQQRRAGKTSTNILAGRWAWAALVALGMPVLGLTLFVTPLLIWIIMQDQEQPWQSYFLAALGPITMVGLAVALFWHRRWTARWKAAGSDVAKALGGQLSPHVGKAAEWLDACWPADVDDRILFASSQAFNISFFIDGFPALIVFDPIRLGGRYGPSYPPRLHLLLAAFVPGVSDVDGQERNIEGAAQDHRDQLLERGFAASLSAGGVHAEADLDVITRWRRSPEALMELVEVARGLSSLARACGAEPAEPLGAAPRTS